MKEGRNPEQLRQDMVVSYFITIIVLLGGMSIVSLIFFGTTGALFSDFVYSAIAVCWFGICPAVFFAIVLSRYISFDKGKYESPSNKSSGN